MRMRRGAEETKLMEKHFDQLNVIFCRNILTITDMSDLRSRVLPSFLSCEKKHKSQRLNATSAIELVEKEERRLCSRGDKDVSMSSILLAIFLGRASALLSAFFTGFRVSSAFPPEARVRGEKEQRRSISLVI